MSDVDNIFVTGGKLCFMEGASVVSHGPWLRVRGGAVSQWSVHQIWLQRADNKE